MADPKDDEHIEELLSQLQGIFGKLSKADEEEAKAKVDVPKPPSLASEPPPMHLNDPFSIQPPGGVSPVPAPAPVATPSPEPIPSTPAPVVEKTPEPTPVPVTPTSDAPLPAPATPIAFDGTSVPTTIFYLANREREAQTLKQKAEALTPKFTKVSFKLQVTLLVPYDPKSEWREAAIQKLKESQTRVFFVLGERPMEEAKRRLLQTETDALKIYFQEVALTSLEKKAFFTDLLLGLVFFFDSLKPKDPGA